jgi:cofilin
LLFFVPKVMGHHISGCLKREISGHQEIILQRKMTVMAMSGIRWNGARGRYVGATMVASDQRHQLLWYLAMSFALSTGRVFPLQRIVVVVSAIRRHFWVTHRIFVCLVSTAQATGVVVDDEVANAFQGFKLQSVGFKLRYYTYIIVDKKTIKIEKSGAREETYEDFCGHLPENDCRYGLIDLEFTTDDGRPTSKLVFITWNPDTASIRNKMLYSGSKEAIKTALSGVGIHINATDPAELDLESSILPVVKKFA